MKIGIVCPYDMIMHAGGVQECVHALQVELNRRGHEVVVITPMPQYFTGKVPAGMVFIGKSKRIRTPQHTSTDIAISIDLTAIDQLLAENQFDLIHIHEPLAPFLAMQMLSRISCPIIGTFHASSPETILAKTMAGSIGLYVKSILKYLDHITAVSTAATSYIDHYKHQPIKYIPNGVDLNLYHPTTSIKTSPTKTILFVGRLEARKGVKYLLKAYEQIIRNHSNLKLVIAGDGPDKTKLLNYVTAQNLPRVSFLGYVSDNEKVKLLQKSSLFCAPALYGESFGIVLLEAMACNLPIIAGDNQGYASVLTGRGQLSLVNPLDTVAFSRQIELLLYDEMLRSAGQNWAQSEIKKYDYGRIVDQYEAVYFQAIHKSKAT